jgi:hypothetical protein
MRTRGAGAQIPAEYQGVTSPFVGMHVIYRPGACDDVELVHDVSYLVKDGAARDASSGEHFTRDRQEPDLSSPRS